MIPYPENEQKKGEINRIVSQGLIKNTSFLTAIKEMYRHLGFKYLLTSWMESAILLLTFAFTVFLTILLSGFDRSETEQAFYAYVFLLSPIFFLSISMFHYAIRKSNETYEVEMVCKYNVYQLIGYRMFFFSAVAIVLNTCFIGVVLTQTSHISFSRAVILSITSLFLFSALFLFALFKRRTLTYVLVVVGVWVIGNVSFGLFFQDVYLYVLTQLPLVVHMTVFLVMFVIYCYYVKRLLHFQQKEGVY
ncbi:hypothetical protein JCM19046_2582 [Bacillus sp. JCM 19046]|nr:hypothetical protein JCM19046_2582 [Bacillus sp. JCM 19046]